MKRAVRLAIKLGWAALDQHHPLLAQVIVTRRCNLSCGYCNEYDSVSAPVPTADLNRRIDLLRRLGTATITFSGGEPLLHPEIDALIAYARKRGALVTLITNGYLLTPQLLRRLNDAGLDQLQISIDNAVPDAVSKKSLSVLDKKLFWLAQHARFAVSINSVLGAGIEDPAGALAVAKRARALGLGSSVAIAHDGRGGLRPLSAEGKAVYDEIRRSGGSFLTRLNGRFLDNLAAGEPNTWRCRAGSRFLYVDEFGFVSYCSQRRGAPGIPLESYTRADLRREHYTTKECAPYCTLNCVQQVAFVDSWRSPQKPPAPRLAETVIS